MLTYAYAWVVVPFDFHRSIPNGTTTYACEVPPLVGSRRAEFANGKPPNSGAAGQWVHTDSTTKSATGTTAPEHHQIRL